MISISKYARPGAASAPKYSVLRSSLCRATILAGIVLFYCISLVAGSADVDLLLYERNPWLMVIGSDSPVFAHYSDGLTIFRSGDGFKFLYLSDRESTGLMKRFSTVENMKDYYSLTLQSDQPTYELYVRKAGMEKRVNVYGSLDEADASRTALPKSLAGNIHYLASFSRDNAADWSPRYLEVMIWPYEHAAEDSIRWPKGFPDVSSPSTVKRSATSYSIYLPNSKQKKFVLFIKTLREKGTALISGKKWAVSMRSPFPHEIARNKALRTAK